MQKALDQDQCVRKRKGLHRYLSALRRGVAMVRLCTMPKRALTLLHSTEREPPSPHIAMIGWGRIEIEGVGTFRDAKVFPGGAREWDWNETGTTHKPGIQPADITELLDHGATMIVLSQGVLGQLHVCPQTLQLLAEHHVTVHVLPTPEAVELYNRLRDQERAAGLFHTTC